MLLQTNSYVVPKEKRSEHARLLRRFRQTLARIGCEHFEVYEQVGSNWSAGEPTGRYVQIMRFRDRRHQQSVQAAERTDPGAQALIAEFCALINFPYQQQQGLFAVGFYTSVLPVAPTRGPQPEAGQQQEAPASEAPAPVQEQVDEAETAAGSTVEQSGAAETSPAAEAESAGEIPQGNGDYSADAMEEIVDPTTAPAEETTEDTADRGMVYEGEEVEALGETGGEDEMDAEGETLGRSDGGGEAVR
jgi:hypothetical protein